MARTVQSLAASGSVRSLERGLSLLVAMNRRQLASASDLAKDTHLPRPTVYRLLDTLCRSRLCQPRQRHRPLSAGAWRARA